MLIQEEGLYYFHYKPFYLFDSNNLLQNLLVLS